MVRTCFHLMIDEFLSSSCFIFLYFMMRRKGGGGLYIGTGEEPIDNSERRIGQAWIIPEGKSVGEERS
jgi:hypothetical protein